MPEPTSVISTGELCRAMGVTVTAAQIKELGFTPEAMPGSGTYWRRSDVPEICSKIAARVSAAPARLA